MPKHLICVLCCLIVVVCSCNADFIDRPSPVDDDIDRPPRYPLLKPLKDKLKWNKDRWKLPVKKIKNKLKHKLALNKLTGGAGGAGGGGILGIINAIEAYVTSSLAILLPNYFSIITTTLTSTSFVTCTASTTACAGRRRRGIVEDLLVKLSQLNNTTPVFGHSDGDDYLKNDPFNGDMPYYFDPEQLEGSMMYDTSATNRPLLTGANDDEMMSQLMMIRQFPDDQLAQLLNDLGFNTIITTETIETTRTITSYPACSSQGAIPQC